MPPKKSKKEQRRELDQQIREYIESGGHVHQVSSGTSGNQNNLNLFRSNGQAEPKSDRTPLTDVVKKLEERKHSKHSGTPKTTKKRPRKRLIVDDFGDPVRWVWEEE